MPERENRDQIPTEYNAEQTQRALRKQDRVEDEQRGKAKKTRDEIDGTYTKIQENITKLRQLSIQKIELEKGQ